MRRGSINIILTESGCTGSCAKSITMENGRPEAECPDHWHRRLETSIPGIEKVVLIDGSYFDGIISITGEDGNVKRYQEEEGVAFVDEEYLDMFYLEWLAGNRKTALENPHSVILAKSPGQQIFR